MQQITNDGLLELASGTPDGRRHLTPEGVRQETEAVLNDIEALFDRAYNLTYLEAKLHCDAYHEGKHDFARMGQTYGYITAFVRRENGTNTMRFGYRRPTSTGTVFRKSIRKTARKGYLPDALRQAAHEYERSLIQLTEEQFERLRKQGKAVRGMWRTLRSIAIFSGRGPGPNDDDDQVR